MKLLIIFAISAVLLQYHFSSSAKIPIPKELADKYEISDTNIGDGSYAIVKSAIHKGTKKKVAIKIIYKERSSNRPEYLKYEVENLKRCDHPNIAKLFQVHDTDKYLYLVMEYASGDNIFDYLFEKRSMKEKDAQAIFRQIVSALQYLHKKKIIHRDLKPENVMLDSSQKYVKLIDFGFSVQFTDNITKLEFYEGSLFNAAPEIIQHIPYIGPNSDIWSLGVILHQMLTGEPYNYNGMADSHKTEYKAPDFLSGDCKELLQKMIVVEPTGRSNIDEIMNHPWVKPDVEIKLSLSDQEQIKKTLKENHYKIENIGKSLEEKNYEADDMYAAYLILERDILNAHALAHLNKP